MPHVPFTAWHKIHGDPLVGLVPINGVNAADVAEAEWTCAGVETITKTDAGGGISVLDGLTALATYPDELTGKIAGAAEAVLVVTVDASETDAIGIGRWRWQASVGGLEPSVVAEGVLVLSRRLVAAT